MTAEERLLRLENAFATLAELAANQNGRIARLEESFLTLVELARRSDERVDQHQEWINQLGAAQAESERKIAALADAQAHTDQRLDGLIDIVRGQHDGSQ